MCTTGQYSAFKEKEFYHGDSIHGDPEEYYVRKVSRAQEDKLARSHLQDKRMSYQERHQGDVSQIF